MSSTSFLTTCCGILPAENVPCDTEVLPASCHLASRLWLSQMPGSAQHGHLLCGLLFPDNWKRQLEGQAMIWILPVSLICNSSGGNASKRARSWSDGVTLAGAWDSPLVHVHCQPRADTPGSEPSPSPDAHFQSTTDHTLSVWEDQVTWFHDPFGNHDQPIRHLTVYQTHLREHLKIQTPRLGPRPTGSSLCSWGQGTGVGGGYRVSGNLHFQKLRQVLTETFRVQVDKCALCGPSSDKALSFSWCCF